MFNAKVFSLFSIIFPFMQGVKPVPRGMLTSGQFYDLAKTMGVQVKRSTVHDWFRTKRFPGLRKDSSHKGGRRLLPEETARAEIGRIVAAQSKARAMVALPALVRESPTDRNTTVRRVRKAALTLRKKAPAALPSSVSRNVFVDADIASRIRADHAMLVSTMTMFGASRALGLEEHVIPHRVKRGFIPAVKVFGKRRVKKILFNVLGKVWGMKNLWRSSDRAAFIDSCRSELAKSLEGMEKKIATTRNTGDFKAARQLASDYNALLAERQRLGLMRAKLVNLRHPK